MSEELVFDEALKLPLDKRAELAVALLKSFDGEPEAEVEAAWAREIERRVSDIRAQRVHLEDWKSVRDQARDRLSR